MKKRIFSFVIMLVTLVSIIVIGSPNIKDTSKTGMEFNGGFDILYEIKGSDDTITGAELTKTAAGGIEKRLDIANTIDPIVTIEGDKYVRVTVSASSQIVAEEIRDIIENNAEISFRDFENNLLATGEDILKDVGATLSDEVDMNGYPVILLNIKDTELLAEITEEVSGKSDTHLVVWLGFEEGDDYARYETDASVAKKIIYNASVSQKLDTETITVTGQFSKSAAQATVDLINSGTLDYELDVVQISSVETRTGESAYNKVLIASLVVIILVIAFLSFTYKLGGLVSSLILAFNVFLTLTLVVTFKTIINQQTIAALIVSIAVSVDALIILFERTNSELYTGKNIRRAFNEAVKKSTTTIVDTNIVILIAAMVMNFLATGVSNFAITLALGTVSTLVVMTLVNRFALSSLINIKNSNTLFGANEKYLENKENYENRKVAKLDTMSNCKKYLFGCGAFATVALIVMIVLQLTTGLLFNYNKTIENNSSVTIVSTQNYFTDKQHIMQFFGEGDLALELTKITTSKYKADGVVKYKVTVETKDSVTAVEDILVDKIIDTFGENKEYDERYELYINDINAKSTLVTSLNVLYATGISLLVVGIYLAIRYHYAYSIAAIITTIATVALTALFFGLTRIKIGNDAIVAIYAVAVYGLNNLIVLFSRLHEMRSKDTKKYLSHEERYETMKKALVSTFARTLKTNIVSIAASVVLLAFASASTYSFYAAFIVGIIIATINTSIISGQVWLLFEGRRDVRSRKFKAKKKSKRFDAVEEQTFIGIND